MFNFIKSLFDSLVKSLSCKKEEPAGADVRLVAGSPDVVIAESGPVVIEKKKGGKKGGAKKGAKSKDI